VYFGEKDNALSRPGKRIAFFRSTFALQCRLDKHTEYTDFTEYIKLI